jgi:2-polyprenyl-6-methoxyphenol hydroxylase-like FAD-dependent oxidoreductase
MTLTPTLDLASATGRRWDVVVVGAGPAGALAACQLARAGRAVLLVDKADFPRHKVCGSCLNGRALSILAAVGLGSLPERRGAVPLDSFILNVRGRSVRLDMHEGVALSRQTFDAALVEAAIEAGAHFMPHTRATPGTTGADDRGVLLDGGDTRLEVRARVVLAADGLAGRFAHGEPEHTARASRIGAGVLAPGGPGFFVPGTIYMASTAAGYVGLVRVEDGRLDIAAALEPSTVRAAGAPGRVAADILRDSGLPAVPGLEELPWRGTPTLTRRAPRLAGERLFVIGDAAGYIEPFTGEGIAWALASAHAVTPFVVRGVERWQPALEPEWAVIYHRQVARRQLSCRVLAEVLRHPALTRACVAVLAHAPFLARPVIRRMNFA